MFATTTFSLPVIYPHTPWGVYPLKDQDTPGRPFAYTPPSRVHHARIEYNARFESFVSDQAVHEDDEVSTSYLTSDSDITTVVRRMNIMFCSHVPFCSFFTYFQC